MALETRHVVGGTLLALAIGGGYAWMQRPERATDQARSEAAATAPAAGADQPAPTLYKWQDDQGVWNYTDQPPQDRPYEAITGTPNVNPVPSVVPDSGVVDEGAPPPQ
jgi:hypothetical protein